MNSTIKKLKKLKQEYICTLGIVEDRFEDILTELYRTATRLDQEIFKEEKNAKKSNKK
jgi:hypothetical protein